MKIQQFIEDLLGPDLPIGVRAYDGTVMGPADPPATLVIRSKDALRWIATSPGEIGFARAYVAGDFEIEGDIHAFVELHKRLPNIKLSPRQWWMALKLIGLRNLRPVTPPVEEAKPQRDRHSRASDAAAIAHHYDVSNDFYRIILGPSMTYSCAVFESDSDPLDQAQAKKHDLICRKLGLGQGDRLLDIGCGWGALALHAAKHYRARVVAITVSDRQVHYARDWVRREGLADGMFEHVGVARMSDYFSKVYTLLRTGGRFLNHAINRRPFQNEALARSGFPNRYVFPDGELIEVGRILSAMQQAGFEARHLENLREHYVLTLKHWCRNLEAQWDAAVAASSIGRVRVWRLYLAGSASRFVGDWIRVNQILAVKTEVGHGTSGMPLRPDWDGPLRD
ncbi:MAG: putative fatty acid methyltransferase [Chromatiales bacterium USCg_Taylor]|nr:MAG: putative fatty acid methyltransferase [Chromatiales bacterium USCg_Taylor]